MSGENHRRVGIISRGEWGARAPSSRNQTSWSARRGFAVHYSSGPPSQTPRGIQGFHMDSNGWSDVGYNFLVDSEGNAYEGRGWLVVGAHAAPYNTSHIGVCFIGSDGDATPAAKAAIRALYEQACEQAGRRLDAVGHRDLNQTSCPGDELYGWVSNGMPADGDGIGGGDDMSLIGLKKGDGPDNGRKEHVIALQSMIVAAGHGEALQPEGVDGRYGGATAEGLRLCREDAGSAAEEGWGDRVSGHAYSQLLQAMTMHEIQRLNA